MREDADIAVIGAGAAGLTAAIAAAEEASRANQNPRIVVLEGAMRVGAKMLASGGGRCNVTNAVVRSEDFNGSRPVVRNILAGFNEIQTRRWFADLGVELKEESDGKLFPVSDKARTVVDALLKRCHDLRVAVRTGVRITSVEPAGSDGLLADGVDLQLAARRVVLATGGRSLPRTGSDGAGWGIARSLGHTVTPTYPALVPLVLGAAGFHHGLAGLSLPVELSIHAGGKLVDRRCGSLLWTHFGISGPVVMDASRHWVIADEQDRSPVVRCSFLPGDDFTAVEDWLTEATRRQPRLTVARHLSRKVPERLARALLDQCSVADGTTLAHLTREQRRRLVQHLVSFELPVERARGWNFAEVTAGGVPLDEIDYRTMASRRHRGLYLAGEILDCDGRIGGFNFQWAWSTGHLAGRGALRSLASELSA